MDTPADELMSKVIAMSRLTGNPQAMLKEAENAERRNPDEYMVYIIKGMALTELNRFQDAKKAYNKALELKPRSAWANYRMGQMLMKAENPKVAAESFAKACKIKPGKYQFWIDKGFAEYENDNFRDAYKSFETAIQHGDKTGWGWHGKSQVFVMLDLLDDALDAAKLANKANPKEEIFQKQEQFIKEELRG